MFSFKGSVDNCITSYRSTSNPIDFLSYYLITSRIIFNLTLHCIKSALQRHIRILYVESIRISSLQPFYFCRHDMWRRRIEVKRQSDLFYHDEHFMYVIICTTRMNVRKHHVDIRSDFIYYRYQHYVAQVLAQISIPVLISMISILRILRIYGR